MIVYNNGIKLHAVSCHLWTINKFLRFTGFRLFVAIHMNEGPSEIGLLWRGFSWLGKEDWNGDWQDDVKKDNYGIEEEDDNN